MSLLLEKILQSDLKKIAEKLLQNIRISEDEAITLYHCNDLLSIGLLADIAIKQRLSKDQKDYVYFINNHHLNLTNICEGNCSFCAYKKKANDDGAFFMSLEDVEEYIVKNVSTDISEIHIVSGINPKANLQYYIDLFKLCKQLLPSTHIQSLTAVEVDYLSKLESISVEQVLGELIKSGIGSLPGGGAEIFNEKVRQRVCPEKISGNRWLEIMEIAHSLGLRSNATMLTGIGESFAHRVEHMSMIRNLQDKTKGFMTFIPLFCHYQNTEIDMPTNNTGFDNLKDLAISRIFFDNIFHIKAFWIQLGIKMAQISLAFGVDDLDGTVMKERISSSAGASFKTGLDINLLINYIRNAAKIPVERDTLYNIVKIYDGRY